MARSDLVRQAIELFFKVRQLPAQEQEEVLARVASENGALAEKTWQILRGDMNYDPRLERPAVERLSEDELVSLVAAAPSEPAEARLHAGQRLADFEVEERIARGGVGEVYRARQLSLGGRPVALKVLASPEPAPDNVARFRREALLLADLHHPSLADVYGFGTWEGGLFIAMRLVPGPTLRELQHEWRRTSAGFAERLEAVLEWAIQVVEALELVHAKGLVHRDVKPSNVILEGHDPPRSHGRAVLIDFGLVRPAGRGLHTETGLQPATRGYASPEQALGLPVGPGSDVFSVGVTMHDLLTNRLVEERDPASAGVPALERLLPACSPDLAAVVAKATAHDGRWRYPDAAAFLRDLRALREGSETTARRRMPIERTQRWLSSRSFLLLKATFVAAGLAGGLAFLSYWRDGSLHLKAARHALGDGDIETLLEESRRVPGFLRRLGGGDDFEGYASTPIAPDSANALGRIAWFTRVGAPERALRDVVTELRVQGPSERPLLARHLQDALLERDPAGALSERARIALRLAARLFYERPDLTSEDSRASEALREALLALLESSDDPNWRYALTALSGCGKSTDAPHIIERLRTSDPSIEDQRLALKVVERLLRRVHAGGTASSVDFAAVEAWLGQMAGPTFAGVQSRWLPMAAQDLDERSNLLRVRARSFIEAAAALALAMRSSGSVMPTSSLLARFDELERQGSLNAGSHLTLRAAFDDPSVRPILREDARALGPYWSGVLCGLIGSPQLDEQVRIALAPDALAAFAEGLSSGTEDREGTRPLNFDLDPDTLLGSELPGWQELESTPDDAPNDPRLVARWRFGARPFRRSGGALSAVMRGGRLLRDERQVDGVVRLAPGESEVRLRFALDERPATAVNLILEHAAAARAYYPFEGEVALEIEVDGRLVQSQWLAGAQKLTRAGEGLLPIARLLPIVFDPGEHELVLRMGSLSTTTYRLYDVELRVDA